MLYEVYQKRIQKIAAFLSALLKLMPLIISIVSVIIVGVITLLACTGLPGKVRCETEIIYGDSYSCEAKAFLSDVRIEFCEEGSDEWTDEKPHMPGNYLTRAVGISVFDKDRFGKAVEFSILPRPVDVKVKDSSVIYGEIPGVTSETVYSDTLACNSVIFASTSQPITQVKPDISDVRFYDSNGNDVTYAYAVNIVESEIIFERRSITVTVDSASKEYDNTPLSLDAYALTGGELAFSDSLGAVFSASITDVGSVDNIPVFQILQSGNGTVADVTELYDITVVKGTLTVTTKVLMFSTGSLEAEYTSGEFSCPEFEINAEAAPIDGHTVSLVSAPSYTNCGTHQNLIVIKVQDANGIDKTANYAIYCDAGSITITPKTIVVTTPDCEWVYDGTNQSSQGAVEVRGIFKGHKINVNQSLVTDVGVYENKCTVSSIVDENNKDVSANYDITYVYGTLTITPRPITFQTQSTNWIYDGKEHSDTAFNTIFGLPLLSGHKLVVTESTKITDAGEKLNEFTAYKIVDSQGNDKTFCYNISFNNGLLTVKQRPIHLNAEDVSKIYDGTPLYGGELRVSPGPSSYDLVDGHIMTAKPSGSQTDVGRSLSDLGSVVIKEGDRDVTHNYDITFFGGLMTVYPRPLKIITGSAEKTYDGKALTSSKYTVYDESTDSTYLPIVVGHTLTVKTTGSQTQIGESPNTYDKSKTKITAQGKDVTKNYSIVYEQGTLKVNPYAVISILTNSDIKIFDGKPLTNSGYEYVVVHGKLQSGHKLKVNVYGSQTLPGKSSNEATATVVDSRGRDVTAYYELNISPGTLEVKELTNNEDAETVFGQIKTVDGGIVYLYMQSYGNYNGQMWSSGINYGKTLPGGYSYNYLTSIAIRNKGVESTWAEIKDCSLTMLPYYIGFKGEYDIPKSDVVYVSNDTDYYMDYYFPISGINGYEEWKGNLGEYSQYEKEYRTFVYKNYLTVDAETAEYMKALISQNKFSLSDPNVIHKIASYIQNAATYSLDYDPMLDVEKNVVIAFLDKYKEGKCVHYASAATLLYRTLGIPARYVQGWMIETVAGEYVDIKNPGHAWVEVYIDDLGWVQVEVTGSDPNAAGGDGSGGGGGADSAMTLKPKYTYKVYDGKTLYALNEIEPDASLAELLRNGYTYEVKTSGSGIATGRTYSKITSFTLYDPNGNDVTDNFKFEYQEGIIDIFDKNTNLITVYLFEIQKVYDGKPLSFNNDDYAIINIGSGMTLDLKLNISLTDAGSLTLSDIMEDIDSFVTYTVKKDGVDITKNCTLIFDTFEHTPSYYVPLRVEHREIGLSSATAAKVDNGEALFNSSVFISSGSLADGEVMEAAAIGYIDYVGTVKNEIYPAISIVNSQGEDVKKNYVINFDNIGTLTIIDKDE